MTVKGRSCAFLGLAGLLCLGAVAAVSANRFWRASYAVSKDTRVIKDRLHALNNRNHEDDSFLNAVGAVWPADIDKAAVGYSASTGFLIDRCHVLTSMHAVYTDDPVLHPAAGKPVAFAVGQTEGEANRGALQGLRFLYAGVVVAHGGAIIVDRRVHDPENDWALIRLAADVDGSIAPMAIAAVDASRLLQNRALSTAGFPSDHRQRRGDRFDLKDLWGSDGRVVAVVRASTAGAVIESTIQTTRGNSGGPLYGAFDGRDHVVIGMVQGMRGNGIDASDAAPNVQLLFTPLTLALIREAQTRTPCP